MMLSVSSDMEERVRASISSGAGPSHETFDDVAAEVLLLSTKPSPARAPNGAASTRAPRASAPRRWDLTGSETTAARRATRQTRRGSPYVGDARRGIS